MVHLLTDIVIGTDDVECLVPRDLGVSVGCYLGGEPGALGLRVGIRCRAGVVGEGGPCPARNQEVDGDIGVVAWRCGRAEVVGQVFGNGFDGGFGGIVGGVGGTGRICDALFGARDDDGARRLDGGLLKKWEECGEAKEGAAEVGGEGLGIEDGG